MLGWLHKRNNTKQFVHEPEAFVSLANSLSDVYKAKLLPLETSFLYSHFHSPPMAEGDFRAKPMIHVIGQYSTGKSSFIQYLLQREYPGIRVSIEPTTDKFICVMGGPKDQIIPGNAVVTDPMLPFTQIAHDMTETFFDRFQASVCSSPVLDGISFIDTPGILSGEKQRADRGYDYEKVTKLFGDRVDMIILMFDAHSLDISDEYGRVITALKGNARKIRIILNKADSVDANTLLRVYGALTWALSKAVGTPESPRIYVGSFWDKPLKHDELRNIFEADTHDLFSEIALLPKNGALRQVDDFIKRARLVRVHACVISHLRSKVHRGVGSRSKYLKLINKMPKIFEEVSMKYGIPKGEFPDPEVFSNGPLANFDLANLPKTNDKNFAAMLSKVDELLTKDLPHIIQLLPSEGMAEKEATVPAIADKSPRKIRKRSAGSGVKSPSYF